MVKKFTHLIIGTGAAGIMAAISAKIHGAKDICLLNATSRLGLKILMSGGGRCNITNADLEFKNFFGEPPNAIRKVILQFPPQKVIDFFVEEGLKVKIEKPWSKYFPRDDSAQSVLDVLLGKLKKLNIAMDYPVKALDFFPEGKNWIVKTNKEDYCVQNLVMAYGGFSYPHTGSDGELWKVLDTLQIQTKKPYAALTPLKIANKQMRKLAGITHWCSLKVKKDSKVVFCENNSVLFTHFGLSGPGILNISGWFTRFLKGCTLEISFIPESNEQKFEQEMIAAIQARSKLVLVNYLAVFLPKRLAQFIVSQANIANKSLQQISKRERKQLLREIFYFSPHVHDHFGYKKAEVTGGGIPFSELDIKTMKVKKHPGLYAIGEVVNVHGIIGGYNFQWAWSSGWVCGKALGNSEQ